MVPPNNSGNSAKPQTINSDKATFQVPKSERVHSDCLEAALACTILAKLETKHGQHFSRISKAGVLQVIGDIRHNRVRIEKANGDEWIVKTIDTSEDKMQVSIVLKGGSIESLLKLDREDPEKLSAILKSACRELNTHSERTLLKLANRMHFNGTGFPSRDTPHVSL
jgi:hypothetical protein